MLDQHYINLVESPIAEHDFAGEDTRYTPEFEALEEELAKDTSVHRTTGTDWPLIREGAELLLQTQSKDLRAVCWLVWSLYHTESYAGLAAGLGMLRHACSQHWPELHPFRIRTRTAAIDWLCNRLEQVLGEQTPSAAQMGSFSSIATHLRDLDSLLTEHLQEAAPQLMPLYRRVDELLKRAEATPPPQATIAPSSTANISQPAVSAAPADAMASLGPPIIDNRDAHRSLRTLQDQARPLTAWWLHQNPGDVRAIRLARTLLWLPIDSLPEHDAQQLTSLRNLPADRVKAYQERFNQGQYLALLSEVETSLNRAPFWLSGQHLAWRCLEALDAQPAMQELESQLRQLLERLPGLDELRFHDGEPFADSDTRQWLASRVLTGEPLAMQSAACEPTDYTVAPWDAAFQEALGLLRQEGLRPAMQLLTQGRRQSEGDRAHFYWQLAEARLCHQARQHEIACARLEALQQTLQSSGLDKWEPTLNLEVLRLLYACCEVLPQNQLVRDRREEIFHRLCHLDFEVVLNKALGP